MDTNWTFLLRSPPSPARPFWNIFAQKYSQIIQRNDGDLNETERNANWTMTSERVSNFNRFGRDLLDWIEGSSKTEKMMSDKW